MQTAQKKPVIGIILDSCKDGDKYSFAPKPWHALRKGYAQAIEEAGGVPVMLPYNQDIDSLLSIIDGLIIPGGDEDIHPRFYSQEIAHARVKTNDERAEFEFRILASALKQDMPVLGICNGLQLINIHFKGTLFQHLPDYIKGDINHEQPAPKDVPSHEIIIEDESLLRALTSEDRPMVNSTHHQAINQLGEGLRISARAPDGVVEAIEATDHRFLVGVEWHPEHLNTELDRNLFKKLVEEAARVV